MLNAGALIRTAAYVGLFSSVGNKYFPKRDLLKLRSHVQQFGGK